MSRWSADLPIVRLLGDGGVFEQARNPRVSGRRRAVAGSAQTPTLKLACLFGGFGHIEQRDGSAAVRLLPPAARALRHRAQRQSRARAPQRRTRRSARPLALRCSSTAGADSEGASSRSMEVNSSSVKSSRQASRSGGCVSIAARSSSSGTWQSMVTSSFDSRTASRFCSSDSR